MTAPMTMPKDGGGRLEAVVAGIDASLVVTVLGVTYSLIAYAGFGPAALPFSLLATTIAILVGGLATNLAGRNFRTIFGPTASGALVVAALVRELQDHPSTHASLDAAVVGAALVVLLAGVVQLTFARLRIGSALKFVPYPVLMGFANTVALLLIISMLPAALGHAYPGRMVEAASWGHDWRPTSLVVAASGVLVGLAAARWAPRVPAGFTALATATLVHYLVAAACVDCVAGPLLDLGSSTAALMPTLSGASIVLGLGLWYWSLVLQSAVVLAILNSLFSLLGAAQLAEPRDPPVDGNRLLRSLGIGNLFAAIGHGLPVANIASPTRAVRMATRRPRTALAVYFIAVVLIFGVGHRWFEWLPMAAIASAVFVGTRNLFDAATWPLLRQLLPGATLRRGTVGPLAVSALVIAVGLFRGLPAALFVGALAAACLLAVEMRRSVVMTVEDARTRRSRRVRSSRDTERLDAMGEQIRVVVLGHWLYFGTADELGDILERPSDARWLLLDLHGIAGIDMTAARSLIHAAERLAERDMHLVVCGLAPGDTRARSIEVFRNHAGHLPLTVITTLDEALERAEDELLGSSPETDDHETLALSGMDERDTASLAAWMEPVSLAARETLFHAGDDGDSFFVIRTGRVTIRIHRDDGSTYRLLTFGANAIFGELALLDHRPRSAAAVADTHCELLKMSRARLDALAVADPSLHAKLLNGIALHLARRLRDTTRLLDLG